MAKLVAILNVVAWAGFWAFGYLALTSGEGRVLPALLLAAVGGGAGLWAWFWLVRHTEATGYAPAPKRAYPEETQGPGVTG
ncbi:MULTISPECIES: hypothetical protein [unclassified Salipiger]|uniref:hypothetical protein n=1 Tax=unclassified Salipiger TaxID=2640570 RepID=UPI00080AA60F|nr:MULTISPECIES: hypothetical protein [unclassified Salipiger]ANT62107.1 hypothetical protein AYJ57_16885 [Salipiger sp. CCB-MM3]NDW00747.1 hypothetical protein [Salipiger sp. PrR002]NDW58416.1 hypothetical protein [Salipiger sp. PrR004]